MDDAEGINHKGNLYRFVEKEHKEPRTVYNYRHIKQVWWNDEKTEKKPYAPCACP